MVGAFPPPVHGMAVVNAEVLESLKKIGVKPIVINVSAASLDRALTVRLSRLPKVLRGLARLLFMHRMHDESFYMSVSAGFGQMYEILFLILARFHRMHIYLHHHNFTYLDQPRFITSVLTDIAGSDCVHVTQSRGMKDHLMKEYTSVGRTVPVSNVVLLRDLDSGQLSPRIRLKTIGFLSNIAKEKGIFEFLDLVSACEDNALELRAKIAGPFQDSHTEQRVRQQISRLGTAEYVGPLYGEAKRRFFNSIDVFIFPTHNETEGIVNHEAMSQGLPVIAYGCGCIPEIIPPACGLVIDPGQPFVHVALDQLKQWIDNPSIFSEVSRSAQEQFKYTLKENIGRWQELLREMADGNA